LNTRFFLEPCDIENFKIDNAIDIPKYFLIN
jgi:hypothetical protein